MKRFAVVFVICAVTLFAAHRLSGLFHPVLADDQAGAAPSLLTRHYTEGEKLSYHMKGNNEGWRYEIQADGVVTKDASGRFVEEYAWSKLISNGEATPLPPASANFRQPLSLDPEVEPFIPNISQVSPALIGPITDLLTVYSDVWLAIRQGGSLHRAGDHVYVKQGTPASWADGHFVLVGEDSVDFDITVSEVNQADHTATLIVRHVPPKEPQITLPADWMRTPVADTPNNWVIVQKNLNGKYLGQIGKETFDDKVKISLTDGRILSAALDNPVEVLSRECEDEMVTKCGASKRSQIRRQIEID